MQGDHSCRSKEVDLMNAVGTPPASVSDHPQAYAWAQTLLCFQLEPISTLDPERRTVSTGHLILTVMKVTRMKTVPSSS